MTAHRQLLRQAALGVAFVAARSLIAQALALAATVVLARSLSALDFGVLAAGLAITGFASTIGDVGLAAGLIRSQREPTSHQLRSALCLQLATLTGLAVVAAGVAWNFGRIGPVTAVMAISLPVLSFQTPARVVLERALRYKRLASVEVVQSATYSGCAVVAVVAGAGVWGVAVATVLQAAIGTLLLLGATPEGRILPTWDATEMKSLASFGLKFQAVNIANLIRDHGLNVAVAAILGVAALGSWNLASRILQAPLTLFGAVWRVSYPAMARLVRADARPRQVLERAVAAASIAAGLILVPLGGSALLAVPLVFGSRWGTVAYTVAPACAALLIGGPISISVGGFLYARGAARDVLIAVIAHTVAWFAVAIPLLPLIGVPAVGIGLIAGSSVDAVVLARAARRAAGARVLRRLLGPCGGGLLIGGAVFGASAFAHPTALTASAAAFVAVVAFVALVEAAARGRFAAFSAAPSVLFREALDLAMTRQRTVPAINFDAPAA